MSSKISLVAKLVHAARAAIDRGDMYIGPESDYPDIHMWASMVDVPVTIQRGNVLLRLPKPRLAVNRDGTVVSIYTVHDGLYFTRGGDAYTINDIAWLEDKQV